MASRDEAGIPMYVVPEHRGSTVSNITISEGCFDLWGSTANSMRFASNLGATDEEESPRNHATNRDGRFDSSHHRGDLSSSTEGPLVKPERKSSVSSSSFSAFSERGNGNDSPNHDGNGSGSNNHAPRNVDQSPGMPRRKPSDRSVQEFPSTLSKPSTKSKMIGEFKAIKPPTKPVRQASNCTAA